MAALLADNKPAQRLLSASPQVCTQVKDGDMRRGAVLLSRSPLRPREIRTPPTLATAPQEKQDCLLAAVGFMDRVLRANVGAETQLQNQAFTSCQRPARHAERDIQVQASNYPTSTARCKAHVYLRKCLCWPIQGVGVRGSSQRHAVYNLEVFLKTKFLTNTQLKNGQRI